MHGYQENALVLYGAQKDKISNNITFKAMTPFSILNSNFYLSNFPKNDKIPQLNPNPKQNDIDVTKKTLNKSYPNQIMLKMSENLILFANNRRKLRPI